MSGATDAHLNDAALGRKVSTQLGCVQAKGALDTWGYGRVKINGVSHGAHRIAYEAKFGAIAEGLVIDHLCRNRACINTDHMEVVTRAENVLRGNSLPAQNNRKETCSRGHIFTESNTRVADGKRICRECRRLDAAKRRRALKAATE